MSKLILLVLSATLAFAADDPWAKVKDLKTGTELRIYKKGSSQPLVVKELGLVPSKREVIFQR